MKHLTILLISILLMSTNWATAQTARGGCSSVTITSTPSYPTVYFAYVGYKNCQDGGGFYQGCDQNGSLACCRVITYGSPTTPRYWLEKLQNNGSWSQIGGSQFTTTFSNLNKGTYRVRVQIPAINEFACNSNVRARMCLFNTSGHYLGLWGRWGSTSYSNNIVVGATNENDISYTFIDSPETGAESTYDYGETVKIDVSECEDYDQWWVAIFEDGPTYSRYRSNGWSFGTIPNSEFNLSNLWGNWNFEPFHTYTVQFVTENRRCRNGIENPNPGGWNNVDRSFFICPANSGCRLGIEEMEIVISPNPAKGIIQLTNFEPDIDYNYLMTVTDMSGRQVKNVFLTSNRVDISDLKSGIFIVTIMREDEIVFNSKLLVDQ